MKKFGPYNFVKFNSSEATQKNENSLSDFFETLKNSVAQNNDTVKSESVNTEEKTTANISDNFVTPKKSLHYIQNQKKLVDTIEKHKRISQKINSKKNNV